eukprot:m.759371 g.759371  ORF g.759371 m.759371 type:complete len:563 (-) comp59043_c0_seq18:1339-3027(-)
MHRRTLIRCAGVPWALFACLLVAAYAELDLVDCTLPENDRQECDDGNNQNVQDMCKGGVCTGSADCSLPQNLNLPCDDNITDTTQDTCMAEGACIGACPPLLYLRGSSCVQSCPVYSLPANGSFTECDSAGILAAGDLCSAECNAPTESRGSTVRVCQPDGRWNGTALTCVEPDYCNPSPCSETSTCARTNSPPWFSCACINGSFGVPGPNGRGCIIPSFTTEGGNFTFATADSGDIAFQIGVAKIVSISVLDTRVTVIADTILGQKVSTAAATLSRSIWQDISAQDSAVAASLTASFSSKLSSALVTAESDATVKTALGITSAGSDVTTRASQTLSTANSNTAAQTSSTRVMTIAQAGVCVIRCLSRCDVLSLLHFSFLSVLPPGLGFHLALQRPCLHGWRALNAAAFHHWHLDGPEHIEQLAAAHTNEFILRLQLCCCCQRPDISDSVGDIEGHLCDKLCRCSLADGADQLQLVNCSSIQRHLRGQYRGCQFKLQLRRIDIHEQCAVVQRHQRLDNSAHADSLMRRSEPCLRLSFEHMQGQQRRHSRFCFKLELRGWQPW